MRIFSFQNDNKNLWHYWSTYIQTLSRDVKSLYDYKWYFLTEYRDLQLEGVDLEKAGFKIEVELTREEGSEAEETVIYFPILLNYHEGLQIGQDGYLCFDPNIYTELKNETEAAVEIDLDSLTKIGAGNIVYSIVQPVSKIGEFYKKTKIENNSSLTIRDHSYDFSSIGCSNNAMNFDNTPQTKDTYIISGKDQYRNDMWHIDRHNPDNYLVIGLATTGYYLVKGTNFFYEDFAQDEYGDSLIINIDKKNPRYFILEDSEKIWDSNSINIQNLFHSSSDNKIKKQIESSNFTTWTDVFPLMSFNYYIEGNIYEEVAADSKISTYSSRENIDKTAFIYYNIKVENGSSDGFFDKMKTEII